MCLPYIESATALSDKETKDDLSTTCNLKVMSRCLSPPDARNHCQYFTILSWIQALDTKRFV